MIINPGGGGGASPRIGVRDAIFNTASDVYVDVTGAAVTVVAGVYAFSFFGIMYGGATAGAQFQVTFPAGSTLVGCYIQNIDPTGATTGQTLNTAITATNAANQLTYFQAQGKLTITNAGSVQMQLKSLKAGGENVAAGPGSGFTIEKT